MKVVWSPLAIQRVTDIAERIAADRPMAARSWVRKLFSEVARLERFPGSGRAVPEVESRADPREIVSGDYRVIYRVEGDRILILTVRHARQITEADGLGPRG